jgi:hypothetical protein
LLKNDTRATCWRWQGAIDKDGYAIVRVGKKVRCGHDVTWEIYNGRAIPPRDNSRTTPAGIRRASGRTIWSW